MDAPFAHAFGSAARRFLGVSADVPRAAAADAFAVIGGLAAVHGTASEALLALTGRRRLSAGYSVL